MIRASAPLPEKASVRSPDGTFCSLKLPLLSTIALADVPTMVTMIAVPIGRNEEAPAPMTTVPAIVAPVMGPAAVWVDDEGDVGDFAESVLPHPSSDAASATTKIQAKTLRIGVLQRVEFTTLRRD